MKYKPNDQPLKDPNAAAFCILEGDPLFIDGKLTKAEKLMGLTLIQLKYMVQRERVYAALKT